MLETSPTINRVGSGQAGYITELWLEVVQMDLEQWQLVVAPFEVPIILNTYPNMSVIGCFDVF